MRQCPQGLPPIDGKGIREINHVLSIGTAPRQLSLHPQARDIGGQRPRLGAVGVGGYEELERENEAFGIDVRLDDFYGFPQRGFAPEGRSAL